MSVIWGSWAEIPGRSADKIKAALAPGSVPLTLQTVENLLDTAIDHLVADVEKFEGIQQLLADDAIHAYQVVP